MYQDNGRSAPLHTGIVDGSPRQLQEFVLPAATVKSLAQLAITPWCLSYSQQRVACMTTSHDENSIKMEQSPHCESTTVRGLWVQVGPLTEELVFRGCPLPLLYSARVDREKIIWLCPLLFGLGGYLGGEGHRYQLVVSSRGGEEDVAIRLQVRVSVLCIWAVDVLRNNVATRLGCHNNKCYNIISPILSGDMTQ